MNFRQKFFHTLSLNPFLCKLIHKHLQSGDVSTAMEMLLSAKSTRVGLFELLTSSTFVGEVNYDKWTTS